MTEDILTSTYISLKEKFRWRAIRILGNVGEVDDVLQDAFYRLWGKRYNIRTGGEAEALLSTAVRNASVDKLRKRRERLPIEKAEGVDDGRQLAADRKYQLEMVKKIVESKLTETQRLILSRREYDNMEYEEIAEELGMQPAAVRMQLSRARKTILECYKDYDKERR